MQNGDRHQSEDDGEGDLVPSDAVSAADRSAEWGPARYLVGGLGIMLLIVGAFVLAGKARERSAERWEANVAENAADWAAERSECYGKVQFLNPEISEELSVNGTYEAMLPSLAVTVWNRTDHTIMWIRVAIRVTAKDGTEVNSGESSLTFLDDPLTPGSRRRTSVFLNHGSRDNLQPLVGEQRLSVQIEKLYDEHDNELHSKMWYRDTPKHDGTLWR